MILIKRKDNKTRSARVTVGPCSYLYRYLHEPITEAYVQGAYARSVGEILLVSPVVWLFNINKVIIQPVYMYTLSSSYHRCVPVCSTGAPCARAGTATAAAAAF